MRHGDNVLTGRIFRVTFASFFVSSIMTVLGTVIDGFVVGNTMDEMSVAAVGLVSPVIILFATIGTIAGISFQVRSLGCLGRGDADGACRALTETMVLGLGVSVILMLAAYRWPDTMMRLTGVSPDSPVMSLCMEYIRGTVPGLPAMTAMAILTRGVMIDGDPKISVISVAVMAVSNIAGDIIGAVWFHTGLYGLTIGTSISYYAGVLVLLWYYRKPDVLIRPALKGISLLETLKVNNIGMPGGIVSVLYSLTLVLRGDMLNIAMEWFNVGETGLRAYHVQVQVGYIVNAFQISAIGVMFLFGALCTAEEDKISFKQIISKVVRYDLLAALIMSAAILCFSGVIARLYLGSGDEALASAEGVLRAFAVGILFQTAVILFANYLQVFSHFVLSALVIIVSNVIVPLFGASYGGAFEQMMSGDIVTGMFEGMTAFHILSALLLPLLIPFVNRRLHGRDLVWMMPKDFGVSPEDELRGMISNQEDVMSFSQKAGEFCTAKGKSERTSYLTSLVIEEVATNVVQHGFTKDDRDNTLSIRLVDKGDELIMRFRDDSPGFDPRSKYESLFANPDISRMIGLRMIMAEAKEVDYTSVFRLNNLIIRIDAASEHS